MKKETIAEQLSKRRYKRPNLFFWRFLINFIANPILLPKHHLKTKIVDDIRDCDGPCFVIYNHQSRMDYLYVGKCCPTTPLNYLVAYNEFFRKKFKFVFKLMNCIPKKNFVTDIDSMEAINSIIKQNGKICFAPEGITSIVGHNQPIVAGTGKFLKHYNIPVYLCKINGAFLSSNKTLIKEKDGPVFANFSLLFTKEDLENQTEQEIQDEVDKALWTDEYEWNKKQHFMYHSKGKICDHLHDLCYKCPKCGTEFKMIGKGNKIVCSHCGNGATQDDYYDFHPLNDNCLIPETISKWADQERKDVYQEIKTNPNFKFEFDAKLGELPKYKYLKHNKTSIDIGFGHILLNHDGFHFDGTKNNKPFIFTLTWAQLTTVYMVNDVTSFSLYFGGEYYEFTPTKPVSFKALLIVEEMHRMHINKWKNFPWMDDIYKK